MVSRELRVVRGQWSVGSNDSPVSDDSCVMCNEWQVVKDEEQLGSGELHEWSQPTGKVNNVQHVDNKQ